MGRAGYGTRTQKLPRRGGKATPDAGIERGRRPDQRGTGAQEEVTPQPEPSAKPSVSFPAKTSEIQPDDFEKEFLSSLDVSKISKAIYQKLFAGEVIYGKNDLKQIAESETE